jgi:hypothetical protein
VTQDGSGAGREHGCEPAALDGQHRVPDGIDPSVHEMKPPGPEATVDGLSAEPESTQLSAPDDAMSCARERG